MSQLRYRVIVLDFDGVLVHSNEIKTEAFRHVFSEFPRHMDEMLLFHHENMALSRVRKFEYFISNCLNRGNDPVLLKRLLGKFSEYVTDRVAECDATHGSVDFLKAFYKRIPLYLASVTPEPELIGILQRRDLLKYFKKVFGDPPVPKALALQKAAHLESCRKDEVLLVGDSMGDVKAARTAGASFIGFNSGLLLPEGSPRFDDWTVLSKFLEDCILTPAHG